MKCIHFIFFARIVLGFWKNATDEFRIKCYLVFDWMVWDLNGLKSMETIETPSSVNNNKVFFSICGNLNGDQCESKDGIQAYLLDSENKCIPISGMISNYNYWKIHFTQDDKKILKIRYNNLTTCKENHNLKYSFELNLTCDENTEGLNFTSELKESDCTFSVNGLSKYGCYHYKYIIEEFYLHYDWTFGVCNILIGLFIVFFGLKYLYVTIVILTYSLIFGLGMLIFEYLLPNDLKFHISIDWLWIIVFGSMPISGVISYLTVKKFPKIFLNVVSIVVGYEFGSFLYKLDYHIIKDSYVAYFIINGVFIIICNILLYLYFKRTFVIISTYFGANCFIKGMSYYSGMLPYNKIIFDLVENQENIEMEYVLNWPFYVFCLILAILLISGSCVQFSLIKKAIDDLSEDDISKGIYSEMGRKDIP